MKRVLLLEDDRDFAQIVQLGMEGTGFQVTICETGTEALELLEQYEFDVLVTDIYVKQHGKVIPDGGILLIGRIRSAALDTSLWRHKDIPILAISGGTAYPGRGNVLSVANSVGATSVLMKPFSQEELIDEIELLLSRT